ncbi:MAG TPA: YceD family protein [Gammaproteobacteria bacterium]
MADTRRLLEGRIALAEMVRLGESLQDSAGEVTVSLEFGIDNEGIRFMRGRIQAEVSLECQRCLETLRFPIDGEFSLAMVRSTVEAEALPSHYEPLLVEGEPLFLRDIIEDELLLALPIVPMHEPDDCPVGTAAEQAAGGMRKDNGTAEKANPFAVLANLKKD